MKEKLVLISCVLILAILTVAVILYKPNITPTTNTIATNTEVTNNISNKDLETIIENTTTSTENTNNIKSDFTFVYKSDYQVLTAVKSNGDTIKLTNNAGAYKTFDIYQGKLYYLDKDYKLHVMSLDNDLDDVTLDFQLPSNVWFICTDGTKLITFANGTEFYQELYDIKTGKMESLPFVGANKEYLHNNIYYYTSREDYSLYGYDINTKEIKHIAKDARIIEAIDNIMYYESNNKLYKYDLDTQKATNLEVTENYFNTSQSFTLTNNNIFLIDFYTLYSHTEDGKLSKLLDLKNNDYDATELTLYTLNDNELLLVEDCLMSDGASEGYGLEYITTNRYIYNIQSNTLEKTTDTKYETFTVNASMNIAYMR